MDPFLDHLQQLHSFLNDPSMSIPEPLNQYLLTLWQLSDNLPLRNKTFVVENALRTIHESYSMLNSCVEEEQRKNELLSSELEELRRQVVPIQTESEGLLTDDSYNFNGDYFADMSPSFNFLPSHSDQIGSRETLTQSVPEEDNPRYSPGPPSMFTSGEELQMAPLSSVTDHPNPNQNVPNPVGLSYSPRPPISGEDVRMRPLSSTERINDHIQQQPNVQNPLEQMPVCLSHPPLTQSYHNNMNADEYNDLEMESIVESSAAPEQEAKTVTTRQPQNIEPTRKPAFDIFAPPLIPAPTRKRKLQEKRVTRNTTTKKRSRKKVGTTDPTLSEESDLEKSIPPQFKDHELTSSSNQMLRENTLTGDYRQSRVASRRCRSGEIDNNNDEDYKPDEDDNSEE